MAKPTSLLGFLGRAPGPVLRTWFKKINFSVILCALPEPGATPKVFDGEKNKVVIILKFTIVRLANEIFVTLSLLQKIH